MNIYINLADERSPGKDDGELLIIGNRVELCAAVN